MEARHGERKSCSPDTVESLQQPVVECLSSMCVCHSIAVPPALRHHAIPPYFIHFNHQSWCKLNDLQVNPAEEKLARWTTCKLSGEPLQPPCVVDELGSLYNKVISRAWDVIGRS